LSKRLCLPELKSLRQPVLRAYADHVAVQLKLHDAWLTRQNAKAQGEQGCWNGEGQI